MRRLSRFACLPRAAALVLAGTFSTICVLPSAFAQGVGSTKAAAPPAPVLKGAKPLKTDKPAKPPDKRTREAAREAYTRAEKAYGAGDYTNAYVGYKKAFELIPTPHAEYWMAKSLDQSGKVPEAIQAYSDFLADPSASKVGDDKVGDAQGRLANLRSKLAGDVNITTVPAGATLSVDGTPEMGETPMSLKLAPGTHRLTISARGYETREVDVAVKGGEKTEQQIELMAKLPPPAEPVAAEPPPAAPMSPMPAPADKHSKVPAYVTLGIATGAAIVGTIFGVQALKAKSDFNDQHTTQHADDTERNALISDMAFGVAITLGVTGIVLLTSSDDTSSKAAKLEHLPSQAKFQWAPYLGRNSGGAAARVTF